jgi:5-methylcytosine-specific restriction endonuclease McrA
MSDRAYYELNKEHIKAKSRAWYAANKEKAAQRGAEYYALNRSKLLALMKAYRAANLEKDLAHSKAWREAHKEEARAYHAKYRGENPEKFRLHHANRKARLRGAAGSHTAAEWLDICERFRNMCAHCGLPKKLTRDHIIPIFWGGSNFAANIQPLCASCNSSKGKRLPWS